jgi:hypothetical protein
MKHTATNDLDHNLEFLSTMSNHLSCCGNYDNSPDRRENLKRIVDNLNDFYAEHGRMPNQTEIDVTFDTRQIGRRIQGTDLRTAKDGRGFDEWLRAGSFHKTRPSKAETYR